MQFHKDGWKIPIHTRAPSPAQRAAGRTRTAQADDALLDEFCDALWLEDGLSRNTLESYRRDLRQFGEWLDRSNGKDLLSADHGDIQGYLGYLFARKAR
ncbi:MAG: site-specific integrase, partial [Burkholderiales bacterium]